MAINPKLIREFRSQSMADKCAFIEANLHYASAKAIVDNAAANIFDVLDEINDPAMVADWLQEKGYAIVHPDNTPAIEELMAQAGVTKEEVLAWCNENRGFFLRSAISNLMVIKQCKNK